MMIFRKKNFLIPKAVEECNTFQVEGHFGRKFSFVIV